MGGLTGETNYILDDICYLDLKTWTWSRTWSFVQRFDHTAWIWGGRLWVLGGIGVEMDRSNELWWLDLKGSPSLSGSGRQTPSVGPCSKWSLRSISTSEQSRQDRYLYGKIREVSMSTALSRREKPTAPGAISSMKFVSGPHVPHQSSGTHFHVCSSGALLDFVTTERAQFDLVTATSPLLSWTL